MTEGTPQKTYKIAVLGGDGIGPEVVREGVRVLERLAQIFEFTVDLTNVPYSANHFIENSTLSVGQGGLYVPNRESEIYDPSKQKLVLPESFLSDMRIHDAMLFGAMGDPRVSEGVLEHLVIGALRWTLDLYANVRPVMLYSQEMTRLNDLTNLDFVIVRENTEGVYTRAGGIRDREDKGTEAYREWFATEHGTRRIIEYAFELAHAQGRDKVISAHKINVMKDDVGKLWKRIFEEVGARYDSIRREYIHADNMAAQLVLKPEQFNGAVVVTDNLFGDILSDEAAAVVGGVYMGASGNIHPGRFSYFESIHGSAPDKAGKGTANPIATILSVGMMLVYIGEREAAQGLDIVIKRCFGQGIFTKTAMSGGLRTTEITDKILEKL